MPRVSIAVEILSPPDRMQILGVYDKPSIAMKLFANPAALNLIFVYEIGSQKPDRIYEYVSSTGRLAQRKIKDFLVDRVTTSNGI